MIKGESDKMMKGDESNVEVKSKKPRKETRPYSFPAYGITIEAESVEEAEKKLLEIINKTND